ncbi:metallo-dependent hydrolase [Pseudohyphozyma bogoriensis]|nr:metallo-dependent hydrolase [Pseudohyphozyma bogoriensis]
MSSDPATLKILNAFLPADDSGKLYDVTCYRDGSWTTIASEPSAKVAQLDVEGNVLASVTTLAEADGDQVLDAMGSLLIPGGLAHPHVHLDKCFLMDRCKPVEGTLAEALVSTSEAKKAFTFEDVVKRGRKLIRDSISHGVTTMRAHVEIDPAVTLTCLKAGLSLKQSFSASCDVEIVAFAQDRFFYPDTPSTEKEMHDLFESVIDLHLSFPSPSTSISAIGSAPYLEADRSLAIKNIEKTFALAKRAGVDVDFHIDYDVDPSTEALVWEVLRIAKLAGNTWEVKGRSRRITMGHSTKLSVFTEEQLDALRKNLEGLEGQVHFVALPPSDLYMQGRATPYGSRPRAVFEASELVGRKIPCCVGINNVGNLFTPQGDADPLAMLPLLVAIWQSAKPDMVKSLLSFVSSAAGLAAGADPTCIFAPIQSQGAGPATFTLIDGCRSLQSAVLAPRFGRTTVFNGRIVGRRTVVSSVDEGAEV